MARKKRKAEGTDPINPSDPSGPAEPRTLRRKSRRRDAAALDAPTVAPPEAAPEAPIEAAEQAPVVRVEPVGPGTIIEVPPSIADGGDAGPWRPIWAPSDPVPPPRPQPVREPEPELAAAEPAEEPEPVRGIPPRPPAGELAGMLAAALARVSGNAYRAVTRRGRWWPVAAAAVLALALLVGVWCYGDARERRGRASAATVERERAARVLRDSAERLSRTVLSAERERARAAATAELEALRDSVERSRVDLDTLRRGLALDRERSTVTVKRRRVGDLASVPIEITIPSEVTAYIDRLERENEQLTRLSIAQAAELESITADFRALSAAYRLAMASGDTSTAVIRALRAELARKEREPGFRAGLGAGGLLGLLLSLLF